jgi:hypothetical protein
VTLGAVTGGGEVVVWEPFGCETTVVVGDALVVEAVDAEVHADAARPRAMTATTQGLTRS